MYFFFSQVLTAQTFIDTTALPVLTAANTNSNQDNQKWNFNSDNSIQSLDGYVLAVYPDTDQILAYEENVPIPNENKEFKIVLVNV